MTDSSNIELKQKRALLKKRARELSLEKQDEVQQSSFINVIEFQLATEIYALETVFIREVYPLTDYTVIPGLPAYVLGIINVRGHIISVINLKKFFNLPENGLGELNKVIILENEHMEFGILADVILGTFRIAAGSFQKKLTNLSEIGNEYLKGVTNGHLIVLDANKMLADKKMVINQITE